MSDQMRISLVLLAPIVLLAALYAWGLTIPVPHLGRGYVERVALPRAGRLLDLPRIEGPEDPSRPLVVIDPGHGGPDPGASGRYVDEKTVVLALGRALREELLASGGVRVAMTREDDRFVVLAERVRIARELGADLLVSIHADSAGEQHDISGASVYTLSMEASSEAAARFAQRENEADTINGINLSGHDDVVGAILVELAQQRASDESARFAALVLREGESTIAFHPQPKRSARLAVLRAPDIPSVLFEAGFVTNPQDERRLSSAAERERFAQAMARAIRIYFATNNTSL